MSTSPLSALNPETSVVMVSYHTGPVLFQAIDCVLKAHGVRELILVNNGNPDDVVATLEKRTAAEPRLKLITGHGNIGFGRACNLGARTASADYLLLLNPDCLLPPDALTKLYTHADTLLRPFMIGARLVNEDGTNQRGCRRAILTPKTAMIEALHLHPLFPKARLNFNHEPIPLGLSPIPAISGAFMFLPRDDFWLIGGFDEDYFLHVEDLDICLRFRRRGGEIFFAPDVVVTHLGGTSHVTSRFTELNKTKGFILYFRKNFAPYLPKPLMVLLYAAIWARAGIKLALARR